ncbi:uncharacterized protein LOC112599810 [Melanaphis sacchari]|uniref:uncharacterized protein LOC112599810 n=1 Tax=Melanaphis sacchari TaxID=742174 RepID=UPI000DC14850|nr:uncharacterized protein LOC112599810 [Melanaphis sacchari]
MSTFYGKSSLRHYFPSLIVKYNQSMNQFPTEQKSSNGNLLSVFRIMWNTNMLLKNMLKINLASETRHDCKRCVDIHSTTVKDLYKTIWKLNMLLKNMMNINLVSEAIYDCKGCIHLHATLTDFYKTIWKLKYL